MKHKSIIKEKASQTDEDLLRELLLPKKPATSRLNMLISYTKSFFNQSRYQHNLNRYIRKSHNANQQRIRGCLIIIIPALLVPIAILLFWWFGFDPNTSIIQPLIW